MSEMLDRVKAAIAEKFAPAIDMRAPYAQVMLDMAARAVFDVMREPTELMVVNIAIEVETDAGGGNNATFTIGPDEAAKVWRDMINEARK